MFYVLLKTKKPNYIIAPSMNCVGTGASQPLIVNIILMRRIVSFFT